MATMLLLPIFSTAPWLSIELCFIWVLESHPLLSSGSSRPLQEASAHHACRSASCAREAHHFFAEITLIQPSKSWKRVTIPCVGRLFDSRFDSTVDSARRALSAGKNRMGRLDLIHTPGL